VLDYVAAFQGSDTDSTFEVNTDFISDRLDAQQITALVSSWQSGVISKPILQDRLVKANYIPAGTDLEKMNQDILDNPVGINLGSM